MDCYLVSAESSTSGDSSLLGWFFDLGSVSTMQLDHWDPLVFPAL